MDDEVIQYLDRARINLSGSIDKTVRIQQAFLRELEKNYKHSDRVKHIINSVQLIKFHCEIQQKILDREITDILDSKEKALKKKHKFDVLPLNGAEYPDWALQAKMFLKAEGLAEMIEESFELPSDASTKNAKDLMKLASKAAFILLRHMEPNLRRHYQRQENPSIIWRSLQQRFNTDRERTLLPILQNEWERLRFYNYSSVTDYASELYRITTEMEHCGDNISEKQKIQKTLSTFNPQNYAISTELEMKEYENFDTLVSVLLRQEKHLNLIQKNEANGADNKDKAPESHYTSPHANKKQGNKKFFKKNHKKGKKFQGYKKNTSSRNNSSSTCHACGMKGH